MSTQEIVSFTDVAATKAKEALSDVEAQGAYVRIASMQACGCGRMEYRMGIEEEPVEGDVVTESNGVKLVVDEKSLPNIEGIEVDYVDELSKSGFKIESPKTARGCGCGGH